MYINRTCFYLFILLFIACSGVQEPQLLKLEGFQIKELGLTNIKISANGVYYNPNPVGITVDSWDIMVTANDVEVGKVDLTVPTDIPAKGNFTIPIEVNFPPSDIFKLNSGLLGGILASFKEKTIDLNYKGTITMDVLGAKVDVPIDENEKIELQKKQEK